ncbi:MAG TPA: hypothetical protein PLK88_00190 [Methanothrix sp.]|nr:hypothetical protein [Methanothrix sp.]HQJ78887.1 hypothetical protein [Methanothrix sp.]
MLSKGLILNNSGCYPLLQLHGSKAGRADLLADYSFASYRSEGKRGLSVVSNSAQEVNKPRKYSRAFSKGSEQTVTRRDEMAYVEIQYLASSMC